MRHRLKNVKNSYNGNGSLFMGHMIHVPIDAPLFGAGGPQQINEVSATQLYVLGARLVTGDGRVFRYGKCHADADITSGKLCVYNYNLLVTQKANIVTACVAGAKSLTVTFNGDFWDKAIAKDELYGGYISLYNSSAIRDQRMIVGNTSITNAGGAAITVEIDEPIVAAVAAAFNCEIMANPYSALRTAGSPYMTAMGMPAALATAGQYFWIQTWGPFRITPTGAELGSETHERLYVFADTGGIRSFQAGNTLGYSEQIAGFLIENTDGGAVGGAAPFIMLQISP